MLVAAYITLGLCFAESVRRERGEDVGSFWLDLATWMTVCLWPIPLLIVLIAMFMDFVEGKRHEDE